MNARLKVYRQLQRQAHIIRAGKDPETAIVAAEEEIAYGRKIQEEERKENEQSELFAAREISALVDSGETPLAVNFAQQPATPAKEAK